MAGPDYIIDIDGVTPGRGAYRGMSSARASLHGRPWLAVYWKCCRLYSRIYRDGTGSVYQGACPKCGRRTRARVGPNGTSARFFEAQ